MFTARHFLSGNRRKRIVTHCVQRPNTVHNDTEETSRFSPYFYPALVGVLALTLPIVYLIPTIFVVGVTRKFLSHIFIFLHERYFKKSQSPGPTSRERLYYYVDYWISTNPYVQTHVLLINSWPRQRRLS